MTGPAAIRLSYDVSAVPARPAGAGRYTLDLADALARRPDVQMTYVARVDDAERWRVLDPASRVLAVAPASRPLRLAWEQARLPGLLRDQPVELHHAPHYTMPEAARLPRVVTVHDCTFFDHPEWHERAKVPVFRRAMRVAARHATAVVCVSGFTADRLAATCSPVVPVHVVAHGVDHRRFHPRSRVPVPSTDTDVAARLGLHGPFIAFVGTLEPRKDVPTLVRAFDRIAASRPDLRLVLAGGAGWGASAVDEAVGRARHGARVVRLGYVPDEVVPALFRSAAVVAYPSLEEGFGLPALEALACGARLVTTQGSALQEVAADAALLVPPGDPAALAGALEASLEGGPEVERRRRLGPELAARYTWEASAAGHVAVYRRALAAASLR